MSKHLQTAEVYCESHKSNPAPELQWFLGGRQLKDAEQTNETEAGDRRWKAVSVLKHAFSQDDFGQPLVFRVNHPAYPNGFQEAATSLDLLCKCHCFKVTSYPFISPFQGTNNIGRRLEL